MADQKFRDLSEMPAPSAFSEMLGVRFVRVTPEEAICEMQVTEAMANRNGVLHGGALMTLADTAAGTTAFANSPAEITNTTVEAKTNFIRPIKVGDIVTARSTPVHVGRTTVVALVSLTRGDGKIVGTTTQTHFLIGWKD